jgi:hypothetical protein
LMSFSLTLQPKRFQLFQPMGGVRASPFSSPRAGAMPKISNPKIGKITLFMMHLLTLQQSTSARVGRQGVE